MVKADRTSTGKYRVRVFVGYDENHKRKYKSFTASKKREAEKMAADYLFEQKQQAEEQSKGQTVFEAVEEYITAKNNVLSASTVRGYYVILNQYMPPIAQKYILLITQHDIQVWVNDLAATHSPKSCRNAHGLLSAVLKELRPDMILRTRLPAKKQNDIYVPEPDEVIEIGKAIEGNRMELPFLLATQCGLRASEICGLERKHILADSIKIEQAVVDGMDGPVKKQPKSNAGYRTIPISQELRSKLLAVETGEDGRICPYTSNDISSSWGKFRAKQGIDKDCNFHALRHYFASHCLLMDMPQLYTAEMMGHGSLEMIERVYQHIFPSARSKYADILREKNAEFMRAIANKGITETGDTDVT